MSLAGVAQETLAIVQRGDYVAPSGERVSIRDAVDEAVRGTLVLRPGSLDDVRSPGGAAPRIEVTGEKTHVAGRRLLEVEGCSRVAVLNFASARNPGGGFLGGAKAQEEDVCRCSALYPCLEPQRSYYDANRSTRSLLYTDHMIWSPGVPFFRDEHLDLVAPAYRLSVLTAPAPNAGEALRHDPRARPAIRDTLRRRAALVLRLALRFEHRVLVLGAWGCGAFRNDPRDSALAFAEALEETRGAFDRVVFAVWERGGDGPNRHAFEERFGRGAPQAS